MKILVENVAGNLFSAAEVVNRYGHAEHVINMRFDGHNYTQVILRVPDDFEFYPKTRLARTRSGRE
jgi:hypothetical protein